MLPTNAWTTKVPTLIGSPYIAGNFPDWHSTTIDIDHIKLQKAGLSDAEKKLTRDLLILVNSSISTVQSREEHKKIMRCSGNLLYFDEPASMKNGIQPANDIVYIYVSLNKGASTYTIDPYIWKVVSRDEQNHLVAAWVETSQLLPLASLAEVRYIQTVDPPLYD